MFAGVPSLSLLLALPGHPSGSLDKSLSGCPSPGLPAELLQGLGLREAPVTVELRLRCRRFLCYGPVSVIMRPASHGSSGAVDQLEIKLG